MGQNKIVKLFCACCRWDEKHARFTFAPFIEGFLNKLRLIHAIVWRVYEVDVTPFNLQAVKIRVQRTWVKIKMKFIIQLFVKFGWCFPVIAIYETITITHVST